MDFSNTGAISMNKRTYTKPKLKTRKIDLGVFGDYGESADGNGNRIIPDPVEVIRNLDLHMG
jgi:hypothetical protein